MLIQIIFIIALSIQFLYWTILYFGIRKNVKEVEPSNTPVSIIVCAHDEEQNLKQLIPILLSQQYETFEVIIVNDCSNDGTYDLLREEAIKDPRLKIVNVNHRPGHVNGKKYGLTLAIKAAQYDWVLLTDADCRPASNSWISNMAAHFTESKNIVLGYSPYNKEQGLLNSFIRFETIVTGLQFLGLAKLGLPYMATGRNLAYQRKIFLDNKGFNSHLHVTGGDDDLFINQHSTGKNTTVALNSGSMVISKAKETWKEYYNQKIRHLSVGKRYKLSSRILLAPFIISWMMFWPITLIGLFTPFWYLILTGIVVRACCMYFAINTFNKKSEEKFETWKIPLLDFIFSFYYLVAGFGAQFSKKIKWKT